MRRSARALGWTCLAMICATVPAAAAADGGRWGDFALVASGGIRITPALTCDACLAPAALAAATAALAYDDGYDPGEVEAWLDHLHQELVRLDRRIAAAPRGPPWWTVGMLGAGTALVAAGVAVAILSGIHRPPGGRTRADILQITLYTSLGGTTQFVAIPLLAVFWHERYARRERLIRKRFDLQREYAYWNQYTRPH